MALATVICINPACVESIHNAHPVVHRNHFIQISIDEPGLLKGFLSTLLTPPESIRIVTAVILKILTRDDAVAHFPLPHLYSKDGMLEGIASLGTYFISQLCYGSPPTAHDLRDIVRKIWCDEIKTSDEEINLATNIVLSCITIDDFIDAGYNINWENVNQLIRLLNLIIKIPGTPIIEEEIRIAPSSI